MIYLIVVAQIPAVEASVIHIAPPTEQFILQLGLSEMNLRGYVWRVPRTRASILAVGTRVQINDLIQFCDDLVAEGFIEGFQDERPKTHVLISGFVKIPSDRRNVITGPYSDPIYDDVVSTTSSADIPILQGPPSPHG
jgi:hypothetical protein